MTRDALELRVGDGQLFAVPAEHGRLPFAMAVNRLCRDSATRPRAIAVELGAAAVAAARTWLVELGAGPAAHFRLPCLLGLVRENRLIHPAKRDQALRLARESGQELHELPPEVLSRELDFHSLAVLPLAATDSIVEAIRCAVELNIPLYGVDLEESASGVRGQAMLDDPWRDPGDIAGFVARLAPRVARLRDDTVDARRETVMAARLKALLNRHGHVLFSGGLGHWHSLSERLADPALRPATVGVDPADSADSDLWRRTVIHPDIAVQSLDAFPALAFEWERGRQHPLLGNAPWSRPARHPRSLQAVLLYRTYVRHFLIDPRDKDRERVWAARGGKTGGKRLVSSLKRNT